MYGDKISANAVYSEKNTRFIKLGYIGGCGI